MIFNSIDYLIFFPLVVVLYFALPHRVRWLLLLVASYVFYMWWNPAFASLIMASTVVDYFAGRAMHGTQNERRRKHLLLLSLCANLGMLFTFKYWNFFNESVQEVFDWAGVGMSMPTFKVLLPVGISFYTFQTLSYTIDLYRDEIEPERHFGRFALYVAFFPQLVAGPIERAKRLLPQLRTPQHFDWERVSSGLQLALWGLFKKVVVADQLAIYVNAVYNNSGQHNGITFILATYAFAFQIYCDFSGYSDIAIGSAKVFGYELMPNFRRPYFATTIVDFWRRWHISLSTWLRDYLYIPLGGNRHGRYKLYRNLMITMILGGLWHGASWNFVIWGTLQGGMLALSRATLPWRNDLNDRLGIPHWLRDSIRVVVTFHLVCLSWIFFRAATLGDSLTILNAIAGDWAAPFIDGQTMAYGAFGVAVLLFVQFIQSNFGPARQLMSQRNIVFRWTVWYFLIFSIVLVGVDGGSQFIYFQF